MNDGNALFLEIYFKHDNIIAIKYGNESRIELGIDGIKFWMFVEKISAAQKISVKRDIFQIFLRPRKTAASAIHPRPLEMFGTKEEIFAQRKIPATAVKPEEITHELIL